MKKLTFDKQSLKSNIFFNSVGSIVYQAAIWLITLFCTLWGGLLDGGILNLAMSTSNVFFTIAIYGMRAFQSSDMNSKYSDKEYVYSRFLTCGIAICCVTVFSFASQKPEVALCMVLYMIFRISEAFIDVLHGINQRFMRMDIVGISFMLRGGISIISFATCLYFSKNLVFSILVMSIASFIVVVLYDIPKTKTLANFNKSAEFKNVFHLLVECFPLVVYAFLNTVITNLPRILLDKQHSKQALAIFAAIAAPAVVVQLSATYIFTPLITSITNSFNNKDKTAFNKIIARTNLSIFAIGLISVIGGFVFCDIGFTILYSSNQDVFVDVMKNKDLLVPVIISAVLTAYVLFYNMILTIIRDFKGLVISNIIGIIACVIASFVLIKPYYLQGTNLAICIALVVQLGCLILFCYNKCKKHFV